MFLYSTVSTLNPIVGIVVTISPSLSLYKMVVLPAASRPTCARSSRRRVASRQSHTLASRIGRITRPRRTLSHVFPLFSRSTHYILHHLSLISRVSRPPRALLGWHSSRARSKSHPSRTPSPSSSRAPSPSTRRVSRRGDISLSKSLSSDLASRSSRASRRVRRREITHYDRRSHRLRECVRSTRWGDSVAMRATHHENAHLLLGEEALEKLGERDAHGERERSSRARVCGDDGDGR